MLPANKREKSQLISVFNLQTMRSSKKKLRQRTHLVGEEYDSEGEKNPPELDPPAVSGWILVLPRLGDEVEHRPDLVA